MVIAAANDRLFAKLTGVLGHPEWASDWTKNHVVAVVHRPFNWASKQRLIAANPFRGVSHLLMEKVTKDLRRSPSTPARPATQPAAEESVVPAPVTPTPPMLRRPTLAPPVAPVQAIRNEAHATPVAHSNERIDYGSEIELPTPVREIERLAAPVSSPVTTAATSSEAIRSVPLPRPSATMARPSLAPDRAPTASLPTPNVEPTTNSDVRQIVVPVTLPPGGRYEIVIKLQIDTEAAGS